MTDVTNMADDMQEVCAKMGLALAMLHEIEWKLANALLFGLNEKAKKRGSTFREERAAREEMTFGRLVLLMQEKWKLRPELTEFLDEFSRERNVFVHKLTRMDGYGLVDNDERRNLEKRVDDFMELCFTADRLFSDALDTSTDFFQDWLKKHKGIDAGVSFPEEVQQRIAEFLELVEPRTSKGGQKG